ncbi:MAG TPA: hypothetical protein VIF57_08910 [Polyangia bacterium]
MLHALVAVLVLRAGQRGARRAAAPPETEAVEVDVEVRADEARSPPPDEVAPAPVPPPRGPSPSPSPRQAGRGDQRDRRVPSPSSGGPAPSPATPAAREAARGGQADDAARVDLSLGGLSDDVKGRIAGPPPPGTLRAPPRRFNVDELRAENDRQRDAVNNVDAGRVDPLLYEYLRGARARFDARASRLADELAVGAGGSLQGWARGYLHTVEEVNSGRIGARDGPPREGGGDTRNEISPHADVLGAYGEAARQAEAGHEERRAEICLDVAAGRETAVVLRRSSGNSELDRLAVESFTKAVAVRPVPPDARRGLACYELSMSAFRMPPLPVFACSFDIGFRPPSCVWPYKKITKVTGRLLTVEYPPADGDKKKAAPSLLRKPR